VALVVVLTLALALGGASPYYSALVDCEVAEGDLGLEGREPYSPVSHRYYGEDSVASADSLVGCKGEDENGEVKISALLLTPSFADQDGAMAGRVDLVHFEVQEDEGDYVEHEVSVGDHSRALDDENLGSPEHSESFVTYASGNIVLTCTAEGEGTPEERIDRAVAACGVYEEAMKAEAPPV